MWSFVFQKTQAKREVYSWKMVGCKKCHMSFPFKAKTNRFFPHSLSWKRNTVFLLELLGSAGPWGSLETHRVLGDAGSVLGTSATCWNYSPLPPSFVPTWKSTFYSKLVRQTCYRQTILPRELFTIHFCLYENCCRRFHALKSTTHWHPLVFWL